MHGLPEGFMDAEFGETGAQSCNNDLAVKEHSHF
jgi:hypothetical protein